MYKFYIFFPFLKGFGIGLGLIMSIGIQNLFVLKRGLLDSNVFIVAFLCSLIDASLIMAGVSGMGVLINKAPWFLLVAKYGAFLFLLLLGALALSRAFKSTQTLKASKKEKESLYFVVISILVVSFLNPQTYLETVILIGSVSLEFQGAAKNYFAAGAICASFLWFFSLGYGARLLAPVFEKPSAWRILDLLVAILMFVIAFSLLSANP